MEKNLVKQVIKNGGSITPLIIPAEHTNGTGLMNPSVIVKDGKIIIIVRHVNYTFYHSEKKLFQHPYGPLTYIHPENDVHLRTWNWYCTIDDQFTVNQCFKVDTSKFDTYEPMWDFVGLEDARIFEWNKKLYLSGVRRDTTTNGQGRMELSEIKVYNSGVKEVSRVRIEPPNDPNSYCEKNWMPILDKPFHYIKWGNPTEVVKVNPANGTSTTVSVSKPISLPRDLRGGSQVLPFKDGYFAITHEVDLFNSEEGRKDAIYYHRFIVWDKDFNIIKATPEFHFMDADVEFSIGMAEYGDDYLITFGFQDNAAYLLKASKQFIEDFIYPENIKTPVLSLSKSSNYDYIEIGTSDFDTLVQTYSDDHKGLSIEPSKAYLDNLPTKKNNIKINAAISNIDDELDFYSVYPKDIETYNLPFWMRGCSSINSTHKGTYDELANRGLLDLYKKEKIRSISFPTLVKEYSIEEVDFLKIDTEGHDFVIIESLLTTSLRPKKIKFEANSLYSEEDIQNITDKLKQNNYKVIQRSFNDITVEYKK